MDADAEANPNVGEYELDDNGRTHRVNEQHLTSFHNLFFIPRFPHEVLNTLYSQTLQREEQNTNPGRKVSSILELIRKNNQELEDILTKNGEQSTETCTLETMFYNEFEEPINTTVIANCPQDTTMYTLNLWNEKDLVPATVALNSTGLPKQ
ncbi:hypothetical protein KY285_004849 [Solanum tuberosum]|nr:hypothetical protein KY289_005289 [Solanum tuberosum]KAH0751701.1 hypothetical protein KY285_004849 [Solanum tuberosum]